MSENKIRIKSSNTYIIDVNDAGETIEFDLEDTDLNRNFLRMYERIDEITLKYEKLAADINARTDKPYKTIEAENPETGDIETKVFFTQNQYDEMLLIDAYFSECRAALDEFFGKDASRKIFGEKNYYSMFTDLFEQLQPHFTKMGFSVKQLTASLAAKYKPNRQQRRALS